MKRNFLVSCDMMVGEEENGAMNVVRGRAKRKKLEARNIAREPSLVTLEFYNK